MSEHSNEHSLDQQKNDQHKTTASRRNFLKTTGAVTAGAIAGGLLPETAAASTAAPVNVNGNANELHSEITCDVCSACRVRASTLQVSAQPLLICLPLSGVGSRQDPEQLPR